MFRRRTVERLLENERRAHQKERGELLAVIRDLNDRLMFMVGRQYDVTPLQAQPDSEIEPDDDDTVADVEQLPDDLGYDPI